MKLTMIFSFLLASLFSCQPKQQEEYTSLKVDDFAALIARPDVQRVDVRTVAEYSEGHIPGSVNHPLERIQTYDGDISAPIFAYCRSGSRSARAVALLKELDYEAVNLGGIIDYRGELER